MLTEEEIKALPNVIEARLTELNNSVLERLGKRIKDIGELKPSDYKKLQQLSEYGSDVDKITSELAAIVQKSEAEIYALINKVAVECYGETSAKETLKALGKNEELQKFVTSMAKQTQDTFVNMSQTTAFMVYDDNGNKVISSLSKTYQNVIDKAVTSVTTGVTDYQSAMRQTLRDLADSGLRTKYRPLQGSAGKAVDYASGYSRRLDTAVRQNILWGAKQCNQTTAEMLGEELGTDGYEISYHSAPRPSHEAMGGRQYAIGKARRINGVSYPSFSTVEHLLQDYNCLHYKIPITLGVSVPTYSDMELAELKANDRRTIEFEGKQYTPYEATQVMRKLETSARHAKDRQIIAKAAGDDVLRREEQLKINQITQKYKEFAEASKLPTKMERMSVSGYHKVKAANKISNKARATDLFDAFDMPENATITPETVFDELSKNKLGKDTLSTVENLPYILKFNYSSESSGERGREDRGLITINIANCNNSKIAASTIIHECTHYIYGIGNSQWAECVCFCKEKMFLTGKDKLTVAEKRDIINKVKKAYPELNWRRGGIVNGRRK